MHADRSAAYLFHRHDIVVLWGIAAVFIGTLAYGWIYNNLMLGLVLGLVFMGLSLGVAAWSKSGALSRVALPVLGMTMVGLMIHVARGHSEAHFAVFAFLACLVVYRSSVAIIAGAVAIAIHHLSFNQFQTWGWGPMCFTEPSFMRVVEHAIYVVVESVVLILLALRARADFATAEELMRIVEQIQGDNGTINLNASHLAVKGRVSRKLVDALQHMAQAVMGMHALEFEHQVFSPKYAVWTAALARTSAGRPSASFWPWCITTTWSDRSMTMPMSCSTMSTVTPHSSRTSRMKRAMSSVSSRFMPATGSSSIRICGCMARARAISTRFCRP